MSKKEKFDFSGYATKTNVKCSDGRTIKQDAFSDMDGKVVPLVWQHGHSSPNDVIGHALLENKKDGTYTYGSFNETDMGLKVKELVQHGDITSLSIYANDLVQKGKDVIHGVIREVSVVLAGANPGALIDNISFEHSDGDITESEDEAIIYSGMELTLGGTLEHADEPKEGDEGDEGEEGETVEDIFNSMTQSQKDLTLALMADTYEKAKGSSVEHKDGGKEVKKNIFEKQGVVEKESEVNTLTHAQFLEIQETAMKCGSYREAFIKHAGDYGIENIDVLFPDAVAVNNTPEFLKRETSWVPGVLSGTHHSPFSRIKSMYADITADEARAKGYIKANQKVEEVFPLFKRITTPQTVYKKQKLDRDDIIDITTLDVVAWLKSEMRMMLDEEIARAILVGDGRQITDPDKIIETNVRPIYTDDEMYSIHTSLPANTAILGTIESIIRARKDYRGSGNPKLYIGPTILTEMLLAKDSQNRYLFNTQAELQSKLRVSEIVEVEMFDNITRNDGTNDLDLVGIIVNLNDYTIGADRGGQISMFDDFDIDFNQYKYLIETRISGALTKIQSALVIEQIVSAG